MNINYVLSTLSSLALFIVLTLFSVPVVYANPVPAFCMLGLLNQESDWAEACEGISSIHERDLVLGKDAKRYSLFGDSIYERDLEAGKNVKRYSLFGDSIYERDLEAGKNVKRYSLFGDSIYERDLEAGKNVKRYSIW